MMTRHVRVHRKRRTVGEKSQTMAKVREIEHAMRRPQRSDDSDLYRLAPLHVCRLRYRAASACCAASTQRDPPLTSHAA